jgi:hypothetical protein
MMISLSMMLPTTNDLDFVVPTSFLLMLPKGAYATLMRGLLYFL